MEKTNCRTALIETLFFSIYQGDGRGLLDFINLVKGISSWDEHFKYSVLLGKQTGGLWRRHIRAVHSGRGQKGGRASFHDDIFS